MNESLAVAYVPRSILVTFGVTINLSVLDPSAVVDPDALGIHNYSTGDSLRILFNNGFDLEKYKRIAKIECLEDS